MTAEPVVVSPREDGVQYFVDHAGSQFYILTNADGCRDFKLVTAPTATPLRAHWVDLVVPPPGDKIEDVDLFEQYLVLYVRRRGESKVTVYPVADSSSGYEVPTARGTLITPAANLDFAAIRVRMQLQHPYAYAAVADFDMAAKRLIPLQEQPIPRHAFDRSKHAVTRISVRSRDGHTQIPVTLLHRRGMDVEIDSGTHPVSLRAYGAYGLCNDPTLRLDVLDLVNSGWVVAYAHVRGGSELGDAWHDDGRLLHKWNTFHDLIDVAEHLCHAGITRPKRIVATGHSAGGLAVAAAALSRPELFRALVLHSPFVDVLSTMLDPSLPLTEGEYDEWGNPLVSREYYDMIASYCPYEQLLRRLARTDAILPLLPSLYVTASRRDQRTPIWQTAKFVAAYRHALNACTGKEQCDVVLHVSDTASHFGDVDQESRTADTAREIAFMHATV
ncbi:prolyl oligopeptidase family-domain-containing protein, partial [Blastocladiella britannica]